MTIGKLLDGIVSRMGIISNFSIFYIIRTLLQRSFSLSILMLFGGAIVCLHFPHVVPRLPRLLFVNIPFPTALEILQSLVLTVFLILENYRLSNCFVHLSGSYPNVFIGNLQYWISVYYMREL